MRGWREVMMAGLLLAGAATARAQDRVDPQPDLPPPPGVGAPVPGDAVTTLGVVRALRPEEEPLDLYRFDNPVQVAPNRFDRDWREPPTPEQVSLSGGYLLMGINQGLMAAARGLHTLTRGPDQIQSAIARPPPLSEDQLRRAAANCEGPECGPAGR